ncbi:MAG: tRNA uridine-5-carboxymethylaminomethyl(34) synthesis GTPase MnmE, partial [Xanthobacteraceae bacterium]
VENNNGHGLGGDASEVWLVENKLDLLEKEPLAEDRSRNSEYSVIYSLSAASGEGVDPLIVGLSAHASAFLASAESGIVTRARHRRALEETVAALDRALAEAGKASGREELIAEELRGAATVLGRLTGRVDVEDILDVIFRDFCIGK